MSAEDKRGNDHKVEVVRGTFRVKLSSLKERSGEVFLKDDHVMLSTDDRGYVDLADGIKYPIEDGDSEIVEILPPDAIVTLTVNAA